ncbi:MAG: PQQ-like beta-propeller repeat protein [Deferrisomatales bacterium]|nr:PQQ-like beta-propeller repeat protein [Deferrisomatales bacterium]
MEERTGRLIWQLDTESEGCYSSPALVDGVIYFGSDGVSANHLFSLQARTGKLRWKRSSPTQIYATPAVVDGVVYYCARDDHVYAVKAADGELVWKTRAGYPQDDFSVFSDMLKSSPAVAGDKLFIGVGLDLLALDRRTGTLLWKASTGGQVDSSPLVVGGTVYVGSDDQNFYGFSADTGAERWRYRTGARISASPQIGEGLVLIGSNDGFLYAFEAAP